MSWSHNLKQNMGILSPVPGALSKSNGFEGINQDTAVVGREWEKCSDI